ncbi:preprotein translocase subunit YajC [Rufibacter immobilis]|uniref:Sec translocon accessory complex subunit YajC n=1 Tax=Rufibacter immobilis TaxID=1348778 RepID=A0A3M9MXQ9_9BACT|nr:preprotein translocase subunit YajC [Rufibacter immobilis]RNI30314.1 preprotein translocase subunit YajC [Rufibacter immobilis]
MLTILLQASAENTNVYANFLFIGLIILVFYFFMLRPQQKKAKDQKKFRDELKRGMNVVTIGGLHGRLLSIDDDTVWIEVDKGIKLKFDKIAIAMEPTSRVNANASTEPTT